LRFREKSYKTYITYTIYHADHNYSEIPRKNLTHGTHIVLRPYVSVANDTSINIDFVPARI
jgi:hypothetical protein